MKKGQNPVRGVQEEDRGCWVPSHAQFSAQLRGLQPLSAQASADHGTSSTSP
jgi:hypothetical protein